MLTTPMSQVVPEATRQLLHDIARTSRNDVLREVIDEIVAGRTTCSDAMRLPAYREATEGAVTRMLRDPEPLGPPFLARCETAAQRYLDTFTRDHGIAIAGRPDRLVDLRREPPP
jgi:hypothetical protein